MSERELPEYLGMWRVRLDPETMEYRIGLWHDGPGYTCLLASNSILAEDLAWMSPAQLAIAIGKIKTKVLALYFSDGAVKAHEGPCQLTKEQKAELQAALKPPSWMTNGVEGDPDVAGIEF